MYGQLILNSNVKTIQSGRNCLFSESFWTADNWISTYKRLNLDPYLTPYTKINSKFIEDLNVRAKTIKFLKKHGSISDNILNASTLTFTYL